MVMSSTRKHLSSKESDVSLIKTTKKNVRVLEGDVTMMCGWKYRIFLDSSSV